MELNQLLKRSIEKKASDVHLSVGLPPVFRINGELVILEDKKILPQDAIILTKQCLTQKNYETFLKQGEIDVAYAIPGVCRFRVNVFKQRGTFTLAFRIIPTEIPTMEELKLPNILKSLATKKRGIILVTGPTGSGKSTTLASLVDFINRTRREHIITIEDPIEYIHCHKESIVVQREIGADTKTFPNALRAALREDPNVILLGEMRDQETIATAITAAETGHLILSTLHTVGSAKTVDRIIDVFPPSQQAQIRRQLSTVISAILSQQLILKKNEEGRIVATEVMTMNSAIANLIREGKTAQINTCIHTGGEFGMYSMDSSLVELYKDGFIDYKTAASYVVDQDNFRKILMV